jgi:formamidopyrimidine-DNA glycosylase
VPELPDVETLKRYFDFTALHQTIDGVDVHAPRMLHEVSAPTLRDRMTGRAFERTERHGKFLLAALDDACWLVLHFGMTGGLEYFEGERNPPEYTCLLVRFANGCRLAGMWRRRLGRISLAGGPAELVEHEGLGPDANDPDLDLGSFKRMMRRRRGAVKAALMDQGFIAGIGNVYSDEMLFQARIHPQTLTRTLSERDLGSLHRALRHVLRIAIERQADPARLPSTWLLPHREQGARCPRCGGKIEKTRSAGRSAYLCPRCQQKRS